MTKGVIFLKKVIREKFTEFSGGGLNDFKLPHVEFNSNCEALVQGCRGVLEYHDHLVRINCGRFLLRFSGSGLCIRALSPDEILVTGEIACFEFTSC